MYSRTHFVYRVKHLVLLFGISLWNGLRRCSSWLCFVKIIFNSNNTVFNGARILTGPFKCIHAIVNANKSLHTKVVWFGGRNLIQYSGFFFKEIFFNGDMYFYCRRFIACFKIRSTTCIFHIVIYKFCLFFFSLIFCTLEFNRKKW